MSYRRLYFEGMAGMALATPLLPATYAAILLWRAQSRRPYLLFAQFGLVFWTFVMYAIIDDALNYFVKIDGSFCSSIADRAACSDVSSRISTPQTLNPVLRRKGMLTRYGWLLHRCWPSQSSGISCLPYWQRPFSAAAA